MISGDGRDLTGRQWLQGFRVGTTQTTCWKLLSTGTSQNGLQAWDWTIHQTTPLASTLALAHVPSRLLKLAVKRRFLFPRLSANLSKPPPKNCIHAGSDTFRTSIFRVTWTFQRFFFPKDR